MMFTQSLGSLPPIERSLQGRRIVLVDAENISGGALTTPSSAHWVQQILKDSLNLPNHEQIVVATSHIGAYYVKAAWPSARIRVRSGEDGADIELLDTLENENLWSRFSEVLLVSGDGIFVDAVAALGAKGVKVTVASWRDGFAKELQLAAYETILLDERITGAGAMEAA